MKKAWRDDPRELDGKDWELMRVPERHRDVNPGEIPERGDPSPKGVVDRYLGELRRYHEAGHGMLLQGPNGVGKTAAACHVLAEFRRHGQSALFTRSETLRQSVVDDVRDVEGRDLWRLAQRVDALLIDDLGKEHGSASGFDANLLEYLLRGRLGDRLVTLMTTNASIQDLREHYRRSTWSVIKGVATPIQFEGPDRRSSEAGEHHRRLRTDSSSGG